MHWNQLRESRVARRVQALLERPWIHVLMSVAILELDLLSGRYLTFPVLFTITVILSAWFCNLRCALVLAIALPVGRLYVAGFFHQFMPPLFLAMNALIQIGVLSLLGYLVARAARQTKQIEKEVEQLEGLLNICVFCKRIKDEQDNWQQLEQYISERSKADFSHGMCRECAQKHYPQIFPKKPNG